MLLNPERQIAGMAAQRLLLSSGDQHFTPHGTHQQMPRSLQYWVSQRRVPWAMTQKQFPGHDFGVALAVEISAPIVIIETRPPFARLTSSRMAREAASSWAISPSQK
jgi:hypothetical protein